MMLFIVSLERLEILVDTGVLEGRREKKSLKFVKFDYQKYRQDIQATGFEKERMKKHSKI